MSACAAQNFTGVTQNVWNCIVAKAASYGVQITTPSGTASASGFTFTWNWNSSAATLMIQCTDSPTLVPCSLINSQIDSNVAACGGTPT